jgi:anti-sigma B factor antagonist
MTGSWERNVAASLLNVQVTDGETRAVTLRVTGEVDMLTEPILVDALHEQLGTSRPAVLDLRPVTFFGTAGLRALLTWLRDADQLRVKVAVVATGQPVRHVLEVTGVRNSVPLFETENEATAFVTGPLLHPVN